MRNKLSPSLSIKAMLLAISLLTPAMAYWLFLFPSASYVMYAKDAVVVLFFITWMWWGYRHRMLAGFTFLFPLLLIMCFAWISSDALLKAKLAGARQLLMPFVFILIGFMARRKAGKEIDLHRFTVVLTIVLLIFGLLLFSMHGRIGWIANYINAKGLETARTGFPYQWIEPILGGLSRMASAFFDPVNFGHYLVFVFFVIALKRPRNIFFIQAVLIGLLFTFCKGAFLQMALVILICYTAFPSWLKWLLVMMVPVGILVVANYHLGVRFHIDGVWKSIETLSFFGYGLGEAGNVAAMHNTDDYIHIHDTYIGALVGQLGVLGLLAWTAAWGVVCFRLYRVNSLLCWLLITQLLVSIYSDNAFNMLSVHFLCTFIGISLGGNNPLRSLSIIDHVGRKAGMDYYTSRLAEAVARLGLPVSVYSNFMHKGAARYFPFFSGKRENVVQKALDFYIGHLRSLLSITAAKGNWVLFHSFGTGKKELSVAWLSRMLGFRHLVILHDVEGFHKDSARIKRLIFNRYTDHILVMNQFSAAELKKRFPGLPPPVSFIRHGHFLDLPSPVLSREEARQRLRLEKNERYFLFFGQIKQVKGLDILINALAQTEKGKLIIAGRVWKDDFSQYDALIRKHGLEERIVRMARFITDEERDLLMKAADVLVLPYREIYQSGVLLLGMSYGLPVIASNLPANAEVIRDGENGLLFEAGNVQDLASKMSLLINAQEQSISLGRTATRTMENEFSWEKSAVVITKIVQA